MVERLLGLVKLGLSLSVANFDGTVNCHCTEGNYACIKSSHLVEDHPNEGIGHMGCTGSIGGIGGMDGIGGIGGIERMGF